MLLPLSLPVFDVNLALWTPRILPRSMATMNLLLREKIEDSWKLLPVKRVDDRYDFSAVLRGGVPTAAADPSAMPALTAKHC